MRNGSVPSCADPWHQNCRKVVNKKGNKNINAVVPQAMETEPQIRPRQQESEPRVESVLTERPEDGNDEQQLSSPIQGDVLQEAVETTSSPGAQSGESTLADALTACPSQNLLYPQTPASVYMTVLTCDRI